MEVDWLAEVIPSKCEQNRAPVAVHFISVGKMASNLHEGLEAVAIANVHAPFSENTKDITNCLPIIKGEVLKIVKIVDDQRVVVENCYGIRGHVSAVNLYRADRYIDEEFYLRDFTSYMAEGLLLDKPTGTYIVRANSREPDKLVISAKFSNVKHYSFQKKEGGIEYDGVFYKSVPSFLNKCSCDVVVEGRLDRLMTLADINVPQTARRSSVSKTAMNMRVVGGY